jgi:hypothetical protein
VGERIGAGCEKSELKPETERMLAYASEQFAVYALRDGKQAAQVGLR